MRSVAPEPRGPAREPRTCAYRSAAALSRLPASNAGFRDVTGERPGVAWRAHLTRDAASPRPTSSTAGKPVALGTLAAVAVKASHAIDPRALGFPRDLAAGVRP